MIGLLLIESHEIWGVKEQIQCNGTSDVVKGWCRKKRKMRSLSLAPYKTYQGEKKVHFFKWMGQGYVGSCRSNF